MGEERGDECRGEELTEGTAEAIRFRRFCGETVLSLVMAEERARWVGTDSEACRSAFENR